MKSTTKTCFQDINLTKKSSEKYHLWHRAVVKSINMDKRICIVKLEHGMKTGEKRKSGSEEVHVKFEEIFPLNGMSRFCSFIPY